MHLKNKEPCKFNLHGDFNFNLVEFIHQLCSCLTGMSLMQKSTACNHGGFDPWIQAPRNHGRESKWLTSTSRQKKLIVQLKEPKWLHTQDDGWYMEQSSLPVLLCAYLLLLGLSRYNTNILTVVECLVQIGFRTWYPEAGEKYVAKCMYCPSFSSFFWVWTQRQLFRVSNFTLCLIFQIQPQTIYFFCISGTNYGVWGWVYVFIFWNFRAKDKETTSEALGIRISGMQVQFLLLLILFSVILIWVILIRVP